MNDERIRAWSELITAGLFAAMWTFYAVSGLAPSRWFVIALACLNGLAVVITAHKLGALR